MNIIDVEINNDWSKYEFHNWDLSLYDIMKCRLMELKMFASEDVIELIQDLEVPPVDYFSFTLDKALNWLEYWIKDTKEICCKFIVNPDIVRRYPNCTSIFVMIVSFDSIHISIVLEYGYGVGDELCRDGRISTVIVRDDTSLYNIACTSKDGWIEWLDDINGKNAKVSYKEFFSRRQSNFREFFSRRQNNQSEIATDKTTQR